MNLLGCTHRICVTACVQCWRHNLLQTRYTWFTVHNDGARKRMRSKGSESGKHCTHARGSHVASGVKNGKVAPPFAEGEILCYIGFITTGPQVAFLRADVALWLPTFQAFRAHVLFFVIVNCEPYVSVILLL